MHNYLALKQKPEENTMSTTQITAIPTGTWNVDPSHSSVEFRVKHLGISTVKGQFKEFEGTLEIGADITASKATGKINAASIDTGEPKRDEHLRSADFFDVENYPYITFESTSIKVIDEDEFHVTGNLTMHGVTKPITLHVEVSDHAEGLLIDLLDAARLEGQLRVGGGVEEVSGAQVLVALGLARVDRRGLDRAGGLRRRDVVADLELALELAERAADGRDAKMLDAEVDARVRRIHVPGAGRNSGDGGGAHDLLLGCFGQAK